MYAIQLFILYFLNSSLSTSEICVQTNVPKAFDSDCQYNPKANLKGVKVPCATKFKICHLSIISNCSLDSGSGSDSPSLTGIIVMEVVSLLKVNVQVVLSILWDIRWIMDRLEMYY